MVLKAIAFDYDGTLVDSYHMLPKLYLDIASKLNLETTLRETFVKAMMAYEDINDFISNYNRLEWWPYAFKAMKIDIPLSKIEEIHNYFIERRIEETVAFPKVRDVLGAINKKLFIIAGTDGIPQLKRIRIERSNLTGFFEKIMIIDEDVRSLAEAIEIISREYEISANEIAYVDDKPSRVIEASEIGLKTFLIKFKGPLHLAWKNKIDVALKKAKLLESIEELLKYI
ncbi:MAG: HAD family hydrolase [Candidatus Odinarchaeota archaeon]|nr:HAD family hydrolase [Candidatus Odinarchaeota archaeon]